MTPAPAHGTETMTGSRLAAIAAAVLLPCTAAAQVELPADVVDDGSVPLAEVRANSDRLFDRFAGPGGNQIQRERFVSLELPPGLVTGRSDRAVLEMLFDALDADGDGRLTRTEWSEQIERQLAFADADGDGRITLEELAKVRENLDLGDALGVIF